MSGKLLSSGKVELKDTKSDGAVFLQYIVCGRGGSRGSPRENRLKSRVSIGKDDICVYLIQQTVDRLKEQGVTGLGFRWGLREDGRIQCQLENVPGGTGMRTNENGAYKHMAPHVRCRNLAPRKIVCDIKGPVECEVEWVDGMPVYILPPCFKIDGK